MRDDDRSFRDQIELVTRAGAYAIGRHAGQERKWAEDQPFVAHLAEVASLLAGAIEQADAELVAAGWLHDSIEKADATQDELMTLFGRRVADLVQEVTDEKGLPEAERKRRQVTETAGKSKEARLLKLADKTSNLRAFAAHADALEDAEACSEYVQWTEAVAAACMGLNRELDLAFQSAAAAAHRAIESQSSSTHRS
jgi:(p)ppGpp synthase/HD superfamily hydrolase